MFYNIVVITGIWKWTKVKRRAVGGDRTKERLLWSREKETVIKRYLGVLDFLQKQPYQRK